MAIDVSVVSAEIRFLLGGLSTSTMSDKLLFIYS